VLQASDLSIEEQILVDLEKTLRLKEGAEKDTKALLELKKDDSISDILKTADKEPVKKKETEKSNEKTKDTKPKDQEESVVEDLRQLLAGFIRKKEVQFHDDKDQKKTSKEDETDAAVKELISLLDDSTAKKEAEDEKQEAKTKLTMRDVLKGINENKREEEKCEDVWKSNDCYRLAYNGTCSVYPKEMNKRCKRSCRFCCADANIGICKTISKLKDVKATCVAKNLHERLRIMCPKTCGFCGKALAEIPCIRSTYGCCWDGSIAKDHIGTERDGCPACKNVKSDSFCERFKSDCSEDYTLAGEQIRFMCPKTCRRCGPHAICRDDPSVKDTCLMLKMQDGCQNIFHAMKFSCAKTCGICKSSTVDCQDTAYGCCADQRTIAKGIFKDGCPECTDKPDTKYDCKYLNKFNACYTHKKAMNKFCAGTCEFCQNNY